jgi:hypothetical protein
VSEFVRLGRWLVSADERDDGWTSDGPDLDGAAAGGKDEGRDRSCLGGQEGGPGILRPDQKWAPGRSWLDDEDWDPEAPGLDDEDWDPDSSPLEGMDDSPGAEGPGRSAVQAAVLEVLEAGFLPRDVSPPGLSALAAEPAAGFASSNELDTMGPCVTLAGFADDVTGLDGRCDRASDDQLIGVLRAWDRLESWTAARKLAVIAELIRRRPAPGCEPDGPAAMPAGWGKFCGDELAAATAASAQGRRQDPHLGP